MSETSIPQHPAVTREKFCRAVVPVGLIEYKALEYVTEGGKRRTKSAGDAWSDSTTADDFADINADLDLYFGVAPRSKKTRGGASVKEHHCLWVDIDKCSPEDLELIDWPVEPSAVVRTGNGYQVYWFLMFGVTYEELKTKLAWLIQELHGDWACVDPGRVFRIPYTTNHKDPNVPKKAFVVKFDAGVTYTLDEFGDAAMPVKDEIARDVKGVGGEAARMKARERLKAHGPAIEGSGGDKHTYIAACLCFELGLSEDDALEILTEWNGTCQPPWSIEELQTKYRNASRHGQNAPGSKAPEVQFADVVKENEAFEGHSDDPRVDWLNKNYHVVQIGGENLFYSKQLNSLGYNTWNSLTTSKFIERCLVGHTLGYKKVGRKEVPYGKFWAESLQQMLSGPRTNTYKGLTLDSKAPTRTVDNEFNMWSGFGVEPVQGDWSMIRQLLDDNTGGGKNTEYVLDWLARMVQQPEEMGRVAIVFRGEEGMGKSMFCNAVLRMMGSHGTKISQVSHILGHFNAHLQGCVLGVIEEAKWAAHKDKEGVLKAIITEETGMMEAKYQQAVNVRHYLHIIMTSNEDRVINAAKKARRYAIFESQVQRSFDWYAKARAEVDGAGPAAMLYDLLRRDISKFDVAALPKTEALTWQKLSSLDSVDRWLYECHQNEWEGLEPNENGWVDTDAVHMSYKGYSSGEKDAVGRIAFGMALSRRYGVQSEKKYARKTHSGKWQHPLDGLKKAAEEVVKILEHD